MRKENMSEKQDKNSKILYRTSIPKHWDYSNADGRWWILEDGTKVPKATKEYSVVDLSKYEVRKFVHKFNAYMQSVLNEGNQLSKTLLPELETSPCKYYTITPKNYLYDDLSRLDQSILWGKESYSYLDILILFAKEIQEFLNKDNKNVCLIEKRVMQQKDLSLKMNEYLLFKDEVYQILKSSNTEMEIIAALEEQTKIEGEGIIVLINGINGHEYINENNITDSKYFDGIVRKIVKVFTPIYDNESFLVWEDIPIKRFYTTVNIEDKEAFERKTHHWECDMLHQELLVIPDILLLESDKYNGNGYYLNRYTKEGKNGGDTWHESIEDAMHQAHFEYEDALGDWEEIPEDVQDALTYVTEFEGKN